MNLRDQLDQIAATAPAPTPGQYDADLTRGRSALRRRRTFQAVGGSAFAVAAVAAAMSFTLTGTASTPGTTAAGPAGISTSASTAAGVKLVAFEGEQPKGFTIDKVPAGFFIQSDEEGYLLLAPDKAKDQPDVNPSTNPLVDPRSFEGKIVIMLQSKDASVPTEGKKVEVEGKNGILFTNPLADYPKGQRPSWAPAPEDEKNTKTLWLQQQDGPWLNVQFDGQIGLTEAQMLEIGGGVEVHEGAEQGVG